MLGILRDYLVTATTAEHFDQIQRAHDLFDNLGLNALDSGFENILMTEDYIDTDTGETVGYIDYLTRQILKQYLLDRMVVLEENIKLEDLVDVAWGLYDIENYEDAAAVLDLCDMDGDAVEKFGEILSLVTTHEAVDIMSLVESVDSVLIDRIREVFAVEDTIQTDIETTEEPLTTASLSNFKAFLSFIGTNDLECVRMVVNGLPIGMGFEMYTNIIGRQFENLAPLDAAREFIGLALLSNDARDNPKIAITNVIEKYVSDFKTVTNIIIIVTDVLVRFQIWKTTESNRLQIETINRGQ